MESFATVANGLQPLTTVVKLSTLNILGNFGYVSSVKTVLTTILIRLTARLTRLLISFKILITASIP